jgi:rare lipoprotein A
MQIAKWCAAPLLVMIGSASACAESGLASFYPGVGKKNEMTCAHRSHAFGKKLRVTHGKASIECRVNDRGPFVRGRIIDVSTSAAHALGMIDAGVVRVLVEEVKEVKKEAGDETRSGRQIDDLQAFSVPRNAL